MVFDEADTILDQGNIEAVGFFMRIVANQEIAEERGAAARAIFVSATFNRTLSAFLESVFDKSVFKLEKIIDEKTHLNLSHIYHNFT